MSRRYFEENNRDRRGRPYGRNQRDEGENWNWKNKEDNLRYQGRERSPHYSHHNQQDRKNERSNYCTPNRVQTLVNREPYDLTNDNEDNISTYPEYTRNQKNFDGNSWQNDYNKRSEREHFYDDSADYMRFNQGGNVRMNMRPDVQLGGGDRNRSYFERPLYNLPRQGSSLPNWRQAPLLSPHQLEAAMFRRPVENTPQPPKYSPFAGRRFKDATCFNCAKKGHSMMGCPRRRNNYMIEFNKFQFQQQKGGLKNAKRYHELDMREFQPGVISEALRKALRLKENQLPKFIYKMRTFGYPTAWLQEAAITPSSITIIDSKTSDESTDSKNIRYNVERLISFPGFNAPPPAGIIDESEIHHAPAYDKDQDLRMMIQVIEEERKEYDDMRDEGRKGGQESKKSVGEGLQDVEIKKKGDEKGEKCLSESSQNFEVTGKDSGKNENGLDNSTRETSDESQLDDSMRNRKKSSLGPVINPLSPYKQLPPVPNFAQGVSDVIAFENLPEATGTYDNIKSVVQKIRNTFKK